MPDRGTPTGAAGSGSVSLVGIAAAAWIATAVIVPRPALGQERPPPSSGDTVFVFDGDSVPFLHAEHTDAACTDCHATEDAHGTVTVNTLRACRSCHHEGATAEPCARCHESGELERAGTYGVPQSLRMSVDTTPSRELPFSHPEHESEPCAACHAEGPGLSADAVRCAECHEEHHTATSPCVACHREAPAESHPLAVHATCTGSGCHAATPVTARTMAESERSVCLSCHADEQDHRPGERCARCHLMPVPSEGGRP